jgi:hypothetical protein
MNNLSQFSTKQNIKILWDVLLDELNIKYDNTQLLVKIKTVFDSNFKLFTTRINPKIGLMELNKQYLSQIVYAVNQLFPNLNQEQQIKRINIMNDVLELEEPYKIEEIHASRQNTFEKLLEKQKNEFDMFMNVQKPKEVDFSDKNSEEKIYAMDTLLAEKLTQRNMELENLQENNYNTVSNINPESWLKSKETSVKTEKIMHTTESNYVNKNLKKVSWNDTDNNITLHIADSIPNIFQKLKKTVEPKIIQNIEEQGQYENHNKEESYDKKYIEQPSIPLPNIKQEIIQHNIGSQTNQINTPQNSPIISNSELIKQMNEMNLKIDLLTDIVNKLVSKIVKNDINDININNPNIKLHSKYTNNERLELNFDEVSFEC